MLSEGIMGSTGYCRINDVIMYTYRVPLQWPFRNQFEVSLLRIHMYHCLPPRASHSRSFLCMDVDVQLHV